MPEVPSKNSLEELNKFTKKLVELCGAENVVVAVSNPPSYIMCFFETYHKEVIIVHKRNVTNDASFEDITFHNTDGEKEGSKLDVTGNPLESPFNDVSIVNESSCSYVLNNDVKVTPMPPGVDMKKARTAINLYSMTMPENSLPIWVVCDGSESKDGGVVRLMCRSKPVGHIVEGWAIDKGSTETEPDPKTYLVRGSVAKDPMKCRVSSRRKISKNTQGGYSAFVTMSWTELVFKPPTTSMSLNTSLCAEYQTGHNDGAMSFIWEQLLLINAFWKSFDNDGSGNSLQKLPVSERVLSQLPNSEVPPSSRILDILQEPIRQSKKPSECEFLINFISEVSSPTYCDLDVLGKLWYLFLECSTPMELKRCLETLQKEVGSKLMGTLMYQVVSSSSLTQATDLITPLKYLIEFGVLKLHREITSILSKNQLTFNVKSLPKFARLPLPEWHEAVASSMSWLAQSFCLLELVCYTQEALNIRNENLYSLAFDFHRQLSSNNEAKDVEWFINNPVQNITINLMPQHVEKNIDGFPDEWLMEMKSTKKPNYVVVSKFFNGTFRPFVLPELEKLFSNTFGSVSMNLNDTTFNQAAALDFTLWSAELTLVHHKIGKDCFPIREK
ncbi:hypothetical protein GE061_019917 [Apolygus lucorum]|uniref:Protein zwilch homolog n=1 Tax=Apolygus lucorum TaxID=248454 RepID=A0A6A4JYW1_APOLU|nr:hypothetical protein GE061_019917 [Apolygus lucorum]